MLLKYLKNTLIENVSIIFPVIYNTRVSRRKNIDYGAPSRIIQLKSENILRMLSWLTIFEDKDNLKYIFNRVEEICSCFLWFFSKEFSLETCHGGSCKLKQNFICLKPTFIRCFLCSKMWENMWTSLLNDSFVASCVV